MPCTDLSGDFLRITEFVILMCVRCNSFFFRQTDVQSFFEHGTKTRREVFFTHLGPGTYRFRVIASNNDGVWNEEGTALEFTILPMFYQTNWFLALCAATVVCLAWLGFRWRVRQVKNLLHVQFQERLAERTRIEFPLHDQ